MQYKLISGVFNCNTKCNQWVFIHCFFVNFFDISLLFNSHSDYYCVALAYQAGTADAPTYRFPSGHTNYTCLCNTLTREFLYTPFWFSEGSQGICFQIPLPCLPRISHRL